MIQILNDVRVKTGRLAGGAYGNALPSGSPFPDKGMRPSRWGYLDTYSTLPSSSLATVYPKYEPFALENFHNTATNRDLPALATSLGSTLFASFGSVPEIQPHERGKFFAKRPLPPVRRAGGVDEKTQTPFHTDAKLQEVRKKVGLVAFRPRPAATSNEKRPFNSWGSGTRLHYDANRTNRAPGTAGAGRWSTVKRGAAG